MNKKKKEEKKNLKKNSVKQKSLNSSGKNLPGMGNVDVVKKSSSGTTFEGNDQKWSQDRLKEKDHNNQYGLIEKK